MMRVLITILLVSIWAPTATAAPSLLALFHKDWDCSATVRLYKGFELLEIGWLEKTFAPDCKCADRLLKDRRDKVVRVHLINSPCMRNKRCGRYEVLWGYNKVSASRAVHIPESRLNRRFNRVLATTAERLKKARGNLSCFVSPCLECDLNGRARRALADRVSAALPQCILVDNPYRQGCLRGSVCESHGGSPRAVAPCIVDMDGISGTELDVSDWARRYRKCELRYYWEPWMNCNRGSFVNPRQRDCKFSKRYFDKTREILCQSFYQSSDTCSR